MYFHNAESLLKRMWEGKPPTYMPGSKKDNLDKAAGKKNQGVLES